MSQIHFPCLGCNITLGARTEQAGKLAVCPKCKTKTAIPVPLPPEPEEEEVWELKFDPEEEAAAPPPPPPIQAAAPGEKPMKFPCGKCGETIEISPRMAGMLMVCPECGVKTLAPEADDVGTYGLGSKKHKREADAPLAAWWPDGTKLKLPSLWRANLAEAREEAENEIWKRAFRLLRELQQVGHEDRVDIDVLRKPLAYCIAGWARDELTRIKEGDGISKAFRGVLKQVRDCKSWGGGVDTGKCLGCGRSLANLIGTIQLRTTAGSAYLCCSRPTNGDVALIQQVHRVSNKLKLAGTLDPESAKVADTIARLPYWYLAIDLSAGCWAARVVSRDMAGGSILGDILGDVLGEAVGDAIGDLL